MRVPDSDVVWLPHLEWLKGEKLKERTRLWAYSNGSLIRDREMLVDFRCPMDLRHYPFDAQHCTVGILLGDENTDNIALAIGGGARGGLQVNLRNIETATRGQRSSHQDELAEQMRGVGNYHLSRWKVGIQCISDAFEDSTDCHPAVIWDLLWKRGVAQALLNVFLPMWLIVLCSCAGLWIDPAAAPARVAMSSITLLSLISLLLANQTAAQPYIMLLDLYFCICISVVTANLLEYAAVNWLNTRFAEKDQLISSRKKNLEDMVQVFRRMEDGTTGMEDPVVDPSPDKSSNDAVPFVQLLSNLPQASCPPPPSNVRTLSLFGNHRSSEKTSHQRSLSAAKGTPLLVGNGTPDTAPICNVPPHLSQQAEEANDSHQPDAVTGAPLCHCGRLCVLTTYADGIYEKGWTCNRCNADGEGVRWFCDVCNDDLCVVCCPLPPLRTDEMESSYGAVVPPHTAGTLPPSAPPALKPLHNLTGSTGNSSDRVNGTGAIEIKYVRVPSSDADFGRFAFSSSGGTGGERSQGGKPGPGSGLRGTPSGTLSRLGSGLGTTAGTRLLLQCPSCGFLYDSGTPLRDQQKEIQCQSCRKTWDKGTWRVVNIEGAACAELPKQKLTPRHRSRWFGNIPSAVPPVMHSPPAALGSPAVLSVTSNSTVKKRGFFGGILSSGGGRVKTAQKAAELNMSPEVVAEAREMFAMLDNDNDGHIDINELRPVLRKMGSSADAIEKSFAVFDSDGDGTLEFSEFLSIMRAHMDRVDLGAKHISRAIRLCGCCGRGIGLSRWRVVQFENRYRVFMPAAFSIVTIVWLSWIFFTAERHFETDD